MSKDYTQQNKAAGKKFLKYAVVAIVAYTFGLAFAATPKTETVYKDKPVYVSSQQCKDAIRTDNQAFIIIGESMEQQTVASIQKVNDFLSTNQATRTSNAAACLNN